jgi:AcrR family transcriptional regulator
MDKACQVTNVPIGLKKMDSVMAMGRPREFDTERALDRATELFWRKGYEGTSLSDLTGAMGITRPSLYAAFGNKQALFLMALDRYEARAGAYRIKALEAPSAFEVASKLLHGAVNLHGDRSNPAGCMGVQSALVSGDDSASIRRELARRRRAGEAAIRRRLQRARTEGDLPAGADPADLARYLSVLIYGMAVQSAGGATRQDLIKVAEVALQNWPPNPE